MIIPFFIAHEGCPHACVFCNQYQISGRQGPPITPAEVRRRIADWLGPQQQTAAKPVLPHQRVEVAFYGGSFTCLSRSRQASLLAAVQPFLHQGLVQRLRISTRPDCIDAERLQLMQQFRVSLIELGVQSCDDEVLRHAGRGHTFQQVREAAAAIRRAQIGLGAQLMLGLPRDRFSSLRASVRQTIALQPECVRIYPTLVLRGSLLAQAYRQGLYKPLSLKKAVLWAAYMKKRFSAAGVKVQRLGLQATVSLEQALIAGPYHPAFGALTASRLMLAQTRRILAQAPKDAQLLLYISPKDQSIFIGPGQANLKRLAQLGLDKRFSLRLDPSLSRDCIEVAPFSPFHSHP